jgi:hypothetical protein
MVKLANFHVKKAPYFMIRKQESIELLDLNSGKTYALLRNVEAVHDYLPYIENKWNEEEGQMEITASYNDGDDRIIVKYLIVPEFLSALKEKYA